MSGRASFGCRPAGSLMLPEAGCSSASVWGSRISNTSVNGLPQTASLEGRNPENSISGLSLAHSYLRMLGSPLFVHMGGGGEWVTGLGSPGWLLTPPAAIAGFELLSLASAWHSFFSTSKMEGAGACEMACTLPVRAWVGLPAPTSGRTQLPVEPAPEQSGTYT